MIKNLRIHKLGFLIISLLCLSAVVFGQDLGSSNSIFKNPKTKTAAKTAPKKVAKKPGSATTAKKNSAKQKSAVRTAVNKTKLPTKSPIKPIPPETTIIEIKKSDVAAKETPNKESLNKEEIPKPTPADNVEPVTNKANNIYDEQFEKAIEDGNAARDAREYTKAEIAYLRAQTLKIKDSRAVYGLGNLYSDQQRWEEAERAYRTAIEIEPASPEAYVALSFVLTQPIIGANLADRYTEAEKLARRAIELDSKNAIAYDQLGVALELGGIISQETQNSYRKAIELDSSFALAYAHLGRLQRKTGLADESVDSYQKAIQLANDVPTMILVADVMQSQQKYKDSEQLLRRALKDDEKNPTALYLLGRALTIRGSYDEAEKVLKKSAEVSPNSFVAYTLLGSMFVRRGKYDDAEKYLTKAVSVVSSNEKKRLAQEFEAVGDGFLRDGKKKDAVRVFRQAVTLDKERTSLNEKLAKAQEK